MQASRSHPKARNEAHELAYVAAYLERAATLARRLPAAALGDIIAAIDAARAADRFIYVMGNGGSAATAAHFANDLGKGEGPMLATPCRVVCLSDNVSVLTAWANDFGYEDVFANQLRALCRPGDVAVAFSGSGNSPNVLNGIAVARERGAVTIGFTGFDGGRLRGLVEHCFLVPSHDMQHVEDMHLVAAHVVYAALRDLRTPAVGRVGRTGARLGAAAT